MAVTIKRKEGEPLSSFLYRVSRRVQQSGILRQARKERFYKKGITRRARWTSAMNRVKMEKQIKALMKQGHTLDEAVALSRKILKGIIKK